MRQQNQVAEVRKLLSHLDTRTTAMADKIYRNPVSTYTCPQQAALERDALSTRSDQYRPRLSVAEPGRLDDP
jgi:hypothetical protein